MQDASWLRADYENQVHHGNPMDIASKDKWKLRERQNGLY